MGTSNPTRETVEEAISDWPDKPKKTAQSILDKYGEPDEATTERLVWHDNGPWKYTIAHRDGPTHNFPVPHNDHLEQYIAYQVPPEKFDEIAQYDGSALTRRTHGELGATCHKEEANFLSVNLSHDIITGEKSTEEAREAYTKIMAKSMAGASPEYMQGLQFDLPEDDQHDPDEKTMTEEIKQEAKEQVEGAASD